MAPRKPKGQLKKAGENPVVPDDAAVAGGVEGSGDDGLVDDMDSLERYVPEGNVVPLEGPGDEEPEVSSNASVEAKVKKLLGSDITETGRKILDEAEESFDIMSPLDGKQRTVMMNNVRKMYNNIHGTVSSSKAGASDYAVATSFYSDEKMQEFFKGISTLNDLLMYCIDLAADVNVELFESKAKGCTKALQQIFCKYAKIVFLCAAVDGFFPSCFYV